jgi:hypothetical protein
MVGSDRIGNYPTNNLDHASGWKLCDIPKLDNDFPELVRRILKAVKESKVKDFIPPFQWQQEHRVNTESQADALKNSPLP